MFFSPNNSDPGGLPGLAVADLNLVLDEWSAGRCDPSLTAEIPNSVRALAGWSLARLGPIYFLDAASAAQKAAVHTIVLFDPGNTGDFADPSGWAKLLGASTPCDFQLPINSLLASWLQSNSANRLLVLTGIDTEEKVNGVSKYAGLWKYYLAGIWSQPFAGQAQICDYDSMLHPDVLRNFASVVNNSSPGCPASPSGRPKLTAWNP